ncbi:hypothetical protein B0A55_02108 [Friedmanniomyces simplex]|uniref:FAD-binding domain-containing protein n=1 Tax=Friedmanniomyces simplex TaxID=329884 RepID=A0A4U0XVX8_9PEZI|nr:hypothetical protein B0A55_02108 [Friedmanniomyces simplex]
MSQINVSIIGAGLSGLVLGRCLLQRGIPCVIFERDTARSGSTRHNYGITLYPWAFQPLLKYLDLNEATFRRVLAVDGVVGGTGRLGSNALPGLDDPDAFRANRRKLEKMLSKGLDVRWEHHLTSTQTEGGSNSMFFREGQRANSSILVGADGPHSRVRTFTAAGSSFNILPFAVYNGRRRVDLKTFEDRYAPSMDGANVVERRLGQTLLQITINDRNKNTVSISYTYSRPARSPVDPIFTPERSTSSASQVPDELFEEIRSLESLDGAFEEVFDAEKMRKDRILNWLMRSVSVEVSERNAAAAQGIVLVGDAAHATPILGGYGANAAIQDGVDLAEYIVRDGTSNLAKFYKDVTWRSYVRDGETQLAKMHGQTKASL